MPTLKRRLERPIKIWWHNGIVEYGPDVPVGAVLVMSTNDDLDAWALLTILCSRNREGNFIAWEMKREESFEQLGKFSDRLEAGYNVRLNQPGRKKKCQE